MLTDLIAEGVDSCLVGNQGGFDSIVLQSLWALKEKHPHITYTTMLFWLICLERKKNGLPMSRWRRSIQRGWNLYIPGTLSPGETSGWFGVGCSCNLHHLFLGQCGSVCRTGGEETETSYQHCISDAYRNWIIEHPLYIGRGPASRGAFNTRYETNYLIVPSRDYH